MIKTANTRNEDFYLKFSLKWRNQNLWWSDVSQLGIHECISTHTLFSKALGSYVDSALGSWKGKAVGLFYLVLEPPWTSWDMDCENPHPPLSSPAHCVLSPVSTRSSGRWRGKQWWWPFCCQIYKPTFGIISSATFQYPSPGWNSLKG